jgi:hypothetical protein
MERTRPARGRNARGLESLAEVIFKALFKSAGMGDVPIIYALVEVLLFVTREIGLC